jgi:hypothetical protein
MQAEPSNTPVQCNTIANSLVVSSADANYAGKTTIKSADFTFDKVDSTYYYFFYCEFQLCLSGKLSHNSSS